MTTELLPGELERMRIAEKIRRKPSADFERLKRATIPRIVDPYIPHIPHPKQQFYLTLGMREAAFGGAAGGGKLLRVDELVLTPFGPKRNGDLKEGDTVVNPRTGGTATVIRAWDSQVQQVWRVHFSDGTYLDCGEDHLWTVRYSGRRVKGYERELAQGHEDAWLGGYRVVTTKMLKEAVDRALRQQEQGRRPNWPHIPVAHASEFTVTSRNPDVTWPVDAYLLGLLIGDGHMPSGRITTLDAEIVESIEQIAQGIGGYIWSDEKDVAIRGTDLKDRLRSLGVHECRSWDKFIPKSYLLAPLSVRIPLMQGLMDTDGYVTPDGKMSYTTVSKQLANDVVWLARSLGAYAKVTTKVPTYQGPDGQKKDGRLAYTVWIKPHNPEMFVWLDRKLQKAKQRQTPPLRKVVKVEVLDEEDEMRCITLDTTDGLYMAGDFVVTHNSDALLMAALQYVDVPGYSALLLRRTWPDLTLPGAIMDRAREWLQGTDATPREGGRYWVFPSGARLQFGHLQYDKDKHGYQSAEFQFIGFDEATQFAEATYQYMFSRLRRPALPCLNCGTPVRKYGSQFKHTNSRVKCRKVFPNPKSLQQYRPALDGTTLFDVPLRMRSATNPGGVGHVWYKTRFIDPRTRVRDAIFVPSLLTDNPSLDQESYIKNLEHLNPTDRERLLRGDWDVEEEGTWFQRHCFGVIEEHPQEWDGGIVRFWDNASTADGGDYTVGTLLVLHEGIWYVTDVVRGQWSPRQKDRVILQTAARDGWHVPVRMEQEPGSSGVDVIDHYRRDVLIGYDFDGIRSTGSKENRAAPVASAAEAGNIYLVNGPWVREWLDEVSLFPNGAHDDCIDSLSGAFEFLRFGRRARLLV